MRSSVAGKEKSFHAAPGTSRGREMTAWQMLPRKLSRMIAMRAPSGFSRQLFLRRLIQKADTRAVAASDPRAAHDSVNVRGAPSLRHMPRAN
jgi:hypothetical protein